MGNPAVTHTSISSISFNVADGLKQKPATVNVASVRKNLFRGSLQTRLPNSPVGVAQFCQHAGWQHSTATASVNVATYCSAIHVMVAFSDTRFVPVVVCKLIRSARSKCQDILKFLAENADSADPLCCATNQAYPFPWYVGQGVRGTGATEIPHGEPRALPMSSRVSSGFW